MDSRQCGAFLSGSSHISVPTHKLPNLLSCLLRVKCVSKSQSVPQIGKQSTGRGEVVIPFFLKEISVKPMIRGKKETVKLAYGQSLKCKLPFIDKKGNI